ncbi:response regulator [Brevibacillus migulae]|uniref:response regulator n=1 Tax=Brevibacillus migulae TaxID=1644114 RepID=UPI00142F5C31|nr:response regulator [Brevibacillus migulae]
MRKIVIVDDDRIIRKGIRHTIPWSENGYEIVGEASDGEQGLQVVEETQPHIVITDIKMPFMDGLEMANAVREKLPETKIILLTGHEDFGYAHEAIKLRAFDYLLKPVDSTVLLEKVNQASKEWEHHQKIKEKLKEGIPFLRQRFLQHLLHSRMDEQNVRTEAEYLGVNLQGPYFSVLLVKADDYFQHAAAERDLVLEKEILKFCIYNICEEIMLTEQRGAVFDGQGDQLVVICSSPADQQTAEAMMAELAERIRVNSKTFLQSTVTIAMGNVYEGWSGIAASYQDACSAIEFRHMIGKDQVFAIKDTGLAPANPSSMDVASLEKELVLKIRLGLKREAIHLVDQFAAALLRDNYCTLHEVRLIAIRIVVLLFREAAECAKGWEEQHRHELTSYYTEVHELQTVLEIFERVKALIGEISGHINDQRENQKNELVEKAMRYMEENYANEELSLQEVATQVHISPTYLSIIFKQEKGVNFSDYLLETRMKKAMEYLRHHNMKAYEVAEKVGYSNPQYFSVCFKKYTGYSPMDFKKQV